MRARTLAALAALTCAYLAATGSAAASTACPGDERIPSAATADEAASALVCDINALRAQNDLEPLRWDDRLRRAAQAHADDMARQHFIGHIGSDGRDLLDRLAGVGYATAAGFVGSENIDWASGVKSSPMSTAFGWMASGDHRENVLARDIEELGVGIAQGSYTTGGTNGTFYVVDFGARSTNAATSSHCARTTRRRHRHRHRTHTHARRVHQRCRT